MTVRSDVAAPALPPTQATSPRAIGTRDRKAALLAAPTANSIRVELVDDEQFLDEGGTVEHLVAGMFTRGALIVFHADTGAGKSFVAVDLSFSIASGREW